MLSALSYQLRREFFKKKSNVVIAILGVLFAALIIGVTHMMYLESDAVRNPDVVAAGISIAAMIVFDFTLAQISSGDLLFTNSDVNFYLAGPFTPKFNLLLPIITCLKTSVILLFVLSCQGAVLGNLLHVSGLDMIVLLIAVFIVSVIGYTFSQIVNALAYDKKVIRNVIEGIFIGLQVIVVLVSAYTLYKEAGSINAIPDLGSDKIITTVGDSIILKIIPIAGWISLITDGIYKASIIKLVFGIALTILSVAVLAFVANTFEFDYYERAIESAQKIAERVAAAKAGVDASANMTKLKNDGKNHVGGWGPSVFFHKHLNENRRATKLFFINKLATLYKIMVIIYCGFMTKTMGDDPSAMVVMALVMLGLLDTIVFAGGKSVVEITKPYFYLIPEKTSKKLFYTVMGGVPEIIFNALLAAVVVMWAYASGINVSIAIAAFVFFFFYDLLCTYTAILAGLIFKSFGKTLLTIVRYMIFWIVVGFIAVVAIICKVVLDISFVGLFVVAAICACVLLLIVSLITSKLIERAECF